MLQNHMNADDNYVPLEIELKEADDFLKVKETLTRIGIPSKIDNTLYQSAHILHKRGRFFIVHLCAEPVIGDEPFAVLLADDLIDAGTPVMRQMTDIAAREDVSVIGVMEVRPEDTGSYGMVEVDSLAGRSAPIRRIVEKPKPGTTRSRLGVVGRYVLTPRILHHLRTMPPGAGGEIQLTDAIARLIGDERVLAYAFEGRRYDCGSKLGYLEATVDFGLKHPETGEAFGRWLAERGDRRS